MLYLIVQMMALLLVSAILGVGIGWLLRGARDRDAYETQASMDAARIANLRRDRDAAESKLAAASETTVSAEQAAMESAPAERAAEADALTDTLTAALTVERDAALAKVATLEAEATAKALEAETHTSSISEGRAAPSGLNGASAAVDLTEAPKPPPIESSAPDNLKLISGVGPKLEAVLIGAGITHFHQIADLTGEQLTDLDEVLNFKGRIKRDDWVGQAKILAAGGETAFSKRKP